MQFTSLNLTKAETSLQFHVEELWHYSPPIDKDDVVLFSRMNVMVFHCLDATIKDILNGGRRTDGCIRDGRFIVGITGDWVPEIGRFLQSGWWYDTKFWTYGHDPIELLAYLNRMSYRRAMGVLAEHFGNVACDDEAGQISRLDGWIQERSPLHVPEDFRGRPLPCSRWVDYVNPVGGLIARAMRFQPLFGDAIILHRTLRRSRRGHTLQWMDVLHERPYPLFNAYQLDQNRGARVIFMPDEFQAEDCGMRSDVVFSAVPGGLLNLMDADLSALSGRDVCIEMGGELLKYGKRFRQCLEVAGVSSAVFTLRSEGRLFPFQEVEDVAVERGVELLDLQANEVLRGPLFPVDFTELMEMKMPEREYVISPILQQRNLSMIHAPRGVGKTHVALGIALAVATGGVFLRWKAPKPRRVLYLDGEMPAEAMQARLASMTSGMEIGPEEGFFCLLNPDLLGGPMPDISSEEGQAAIDPYLTGVELVVLDNLSTLCRSTRENEGDSWGPVQGWLLELRRRGIAVLVVHHSGKNGSQRGTSRREDVLDTVLNLRHPKDYSAAQGARFEVHIEKGRNLFGADAEPFEAQLDVQDGVAIWSVADQADPVTERAIELLRAGSSLRVIESEVGISKSTLGRLRQKMVGNGELDY
jgi:hypothetical protein